MNKGTIEKRIATLEMQTRADKWTAYLAWLEGLPEFEAPEFNAETAVEIDVALCSRFLELIKPHSFDEDEHEAALDAAENTSMTRDQIMRQFDPPRPPSRADTLECQRFAAITAGILESAVLSTDERAFLLAVKAAHEWGASGGGADVLQSVSAQ